MKDYKEILKGQIVEKSGPLPNAKVQVYDKDLLINDHLGDAVTDSEGRFQVSFMWSDYKDHPFEGKPDIFLKVEHPTTGNVTKTQVFDELEGKIAPDDDDLEIYDLGVIELP